MMAFTARQVTCHAQDGCVHIGFDLAGSTAGYVLISVPESGTGMEAEFYDADHYVEVLDQLHGRYGGIRSLRVHGDREVRLILHYPVPGVGDELVIIAGEPIAGNILAQLDDLVR